MKKLTLTELIECCIHQNWEDLNPCEIFIDRLDFPEGDCEGTYCHAVLGEVGSVEIENDEVVLNFIEQL